MTQRKKPALPRKAASPPREHFLNPDEPRWEESLTHAEGSMRERWLKLATMHWLSEHVPNEAAAKVSAFLDAYYRPAAVALRYLVNTPASNQAIMTAASLPLYMVLGDPTQPIANAWIDYAHEKYAGYPPRQEDFDRRAADWLRQVVIGKRTDILGHLIKALEMIQCDLEVGIHPVSVLASVKGSGTDSDHHFLIHVHHALYEWMKDHGRLPTKKELGKAAQRRRVGGQKNPPDVDASNWSKTLKMLGLNGLPSHPKREKKGR